MSLRFVYIRSIYRTSFELPLNIELEPTSTPLEITPTETTKYVTTAPVPETTTKIGLKFIFSLYLYLILVISEISLHFEVFLHSHFLH